MMFEKDQLLKLAVETYVHALDTDSPICSTSHFTLIRIVRELEAFGINREELYAALEDYWNAS